MYASVYGWTKCLCYIPSPLLFCGAAAPAVDRLISGGVALRVSGTELPPKVGEDEAEAEADDGDERRTLGSKPCGDGCRNDVTERAVGLGTPTLRLSKEDKADRGERADDGDRVAVIEEGREKGADVAEAEGDSVCSGGGGTGGGGLRRRRPVDGESSTLRSTLRSSSSASCPLLPVSLAGSLWPLSLSCSLRSSLSSLSFLSFSLSLLYFCTSSSSCLILSRSLSLSRSFSLSFSTSFSLSCLCCLTNCW